MKILRSPTERGRPSTVTSAARDSWQLHLLVFATIQGNILCRSGTTSHKCGRPLSYLVPPSPSEHSPWLATIPPLGQLDTYEEAVLSSPNSHVLTWSGNVVQRNHTSNWATGLYYLFWGAKKMAVCEALVLYRHINECQKGEGRSLGVALSCTLLTAAISAQWVATLYTIS